MKTKLTAIESVVFKQACKIWDQAEDPDNTHPAIVVDAVVGARRLRTKIRKSVVADELARWIRDHANPTGWPSVANPRALPPFDQRMKSLLPLKTIDTARRLLFHSFTDIEFIYKDLTEEERSLVSKEEFENLLHQFRLR